MYIHELKAWPRFTWQGNLIQTQVAEVQQKEWKLLGKMESIGFKAQEENTLNAITNDVIKSSEIEGEILDYTQVRSSVARHLGIKIACSLPSDRHVDGVVEMLLDATQKYQKQLTKKRLWSWHASLFPMGRSGFTKINIGNWRKGPIQVISGRYDKEKIHFEGPSAQVVDQEMKHFLKWFNSENSLNPLIKASIAHLWFLTIHPFDDGNGRIGRAIVDLMLARAENSSQRFYSLSSQIQKERKNYYAILEETQKGNLDITKWISWFLHTLEQAIDATQATLSKVLYKGQVWEKLHTIPLNVRQRKMIDKLLQDFEGNLTTTKWAKMCKCSQDTAYRDILDLLDKKILAPSLEKGRSTSYFLRTKNF